MTPYPVGIQCCPNPTCRKSYDISTGELLVKHRVEHYLGSRNLGNLSDLEKETTRGKVFEWWKSRNDGNRRHLGASQIGKRCERALWYSFRWAKSPEFSGRIMRLFHRGHMEEYTFMMELEGIGVKFIYPENNPEQQWRFTAHENHFGGSCDGLIESGVPEAPKSRHIAEFKTHSSKSWVDVSRKGVQEAKPEHYIQMQCYMGMTGELWGASRRVERALYVAVNKDNDDLHIERVRFDMKVWESMKDKAERIIYANKAPSGISQNPQWYECKFCDYYNLCHKEELPERNCRTCAHSTAIKEGKWLCDYHAVELTDQTERVGCDNYLMNPTMIDTWSIAVDAGDDWIKYKRNDDGKEFTLGGQCATS